MFMLSANYVGAGQQRLGGVQGERLISLQDQHVVGFQFPGDQPGGLADGMQSPKMPDIRQISGDRSPPPSWRQCAIRTEQSSYGRGPATCRTLRGIAGREKTLTPGRRVTGLRPVGAR
jgi:hypothetical protein